MYTRATCVIKLGGKLGQPFTTNVGLRQGDPMSPLLFNLFVADILFAFTKGCDPPSLHDVQFADDICNFPKTLAGIKQFSVLWIIVGLTTSNLT